MSRVRRDDCGFRRLWRGADIGAALGAALWRLVQGGGQGVDTGLWQLWRGADIGAALRRLVRGRRSRLIETTARQVRGIPYRGVNMFRGIPYAGPIQR